jgi:Tfp pilus assembly protein PilF
VIVLVCAASLTALFYATAEQAKKWSTALDLWSHAVTVSPDSSIVHTNLADAFMALGNVRIAADHYRRAMEIQPRDAIAAHHFGDALSAMGNDRAAETLPSGLSLDPSRPRVFINLASCGLLVAKHTRPPISFAIQVQQARMTVRRISGGVACHPS